MVLLEVGFPAIWRTKECPRRCTSPKRTTREAAYIEAVSAFYEGEDKTFRQRLADWAAKQRQIDEAFPDDLDAAAFDALAQLTMAPRGPDAVPELTDAGARMDALRDNPAQPTSVRFGEAAPQRQI